MLTHLHIRNYALIRSLDIDFASGFGVITGETGAGKSIILGALALVMGAKADAKSISEGEERCIIEATFNTTDGELLIRRELNQSGRSRSFVNDEVVSQQELKRLSSQLIDIHSQHENLLLADDTFQLSIIDALAGNQAERDAYQTAYSTYTETAHRLHEIESLARKTKADADYIQFQFNQLDEARLVENEDEDLEREQYTLSHAEDIRGAYQQADNLLDSGEMNVLGMLRDIHLEDADSELHERLNSVIIELRDIAHEVNRQADRIEADPERLLWVEQRLDLLNTLMRKHNVSSVSDLITLREQLSEQCQQIDSFDEQIAALQQELSQRRAEMEKCGMALRQTRDKVRPTIVKSLVRDLATLGIAHPQVEIEINALPDCTESGMDDVQFLFAANLNQTVRRVSEVASGGEISRLMLCIKSLIASTNGLPTIIFDEIDTGVSGEVAAQMGRIMGEMAVSRQIIAITHLPQIAAAGQHHYKVYKADTDSRTETNIQVLTNEQRIDEIATMLSGKHPTDAARENAKQLLCKI